MRAVLRSVLLCALVFAACAPVPQYKRGGLARRHMAFQDDPDEVILENHLIDSREGSSGASGARGGGCGCN